MQTLQYAFRMLLKNPVVTLVAVITLALGIGANTAIFSVVNGVLLRPLPYKDADRLVALWENVPEHGRWRAAPANFFDWKKQNTVFEDMSVYGASTMTLTGQGEPEQLQGARVGSGYFNVIGVAPIRGRAFLPEEYEPGKGQVVILGYALWQRRFGADENIVGKTITLDGDIYQIIGVMGPGTYPARPTTTGQISFDEQAQQYWHPMSFTAGWAAVRTAHVFGVLGRLKPNVSLEQAQAEMNTIGARLEQQYPANKGEGIIVNAIMNEVVGDVRPALLTLMFAVGLVLLIACANIAGLLLAQHAARSKEIAIRAALGANRFRLTYQFFIEALLLSMLGALSGIILAKIGIDVLLRLIPEDFPRLGLVKIDWRVLGFTLALSLITCLVFALVPAWQASKPDLHATLEQSGRTSGPGANRLRFRQLLVVFQVSMAVMLVIAAGLLIKSFWRLRSVDPGFQAEHVVKLDLTLSSKYAKPEAINQFFKEFNDSVSKLPGVQSVAIAYDHPLQTNWVDSFQIEGRVSATQDSLQANFNPIGPDYFKTLGMHLMSGRGFTAQDDQDHPGVAVVNESFVRHYFPNESPFGRHITPGPPGRIWQGKKLTSFEIVGVVHDVKSAGLQAPTAPTYYLPAAQAPLQDMAVIVRTTTEPLSIIPELRQAVLAIDPDQPISNISTMEKIVSDSIARPRLNMFLMGLFGALALILASVGIYGLLSYSVTQRTQEMGIRMALGAQVTDVLKLVLRQGMTLALIGEALGLIGAFALTRVMQRLLFGVTPTDATIFISVVGILTTTAVLACYLPARRAAKVDPLVALRYE
ncbi:MAG TPA: ABC transporter permease [Pyrinomonadaceae bacterium]|nr:ABC transporter permease [Pyrinomonadaceae bacterium]